MARTKKSSDIPTKSPPSTPQIPRKRRVKKRHHLVLIFVVAVAMAFFIVTRSGVLSYLFLPRIESALNCEAKCGRAVLTSGGQLIIRDLVLTVPTVDGPASQVLEATRVDIDLVLDSLWPGSLRPGRITLHSPVIRVSQADDFTVNIEPLFAPRSASTSLRIPEISISNARLEMGEHRGVEYSPFLTLFVRGELVADADNPRRYVIDFVEEPPAEVPVVDRKRTKVHGDVNLDLGTATIQAKNIDLTQWTQRSSSKSSFRGYWDQLNLQGLIPTSTVTFDPVEGMAAEFELDNVELTIPVPVTEQGDEGVSGDSPLEFVSMTGVNGTIRFARKGLKASLEGSVEDLESTVVLSTEGLSLAAPLSCTIITPDFLIEEQPVLLPYAPPLARRVFALFSGPSARLGGRVQITRRVDPQSGDYEWFYEGAYELEGGQARYGQFPYPFEEITGKFIFDQDKFEMPLIKGRGPTGARVLAKGLIQPPGPEAEVNIEVTLVEMPMDEVFEDSLPEEHRGVYDVLFDIGAYAKLVGLGLIVPTSEAVDLGPDEPTAYPFELGGTATLHVDVHRPPGIEKQYEADVKLEIPRAGVLTKAFPYPAIASDVSIRIRDGIAEIATCDLAGLSGATGHLQGRVEYSTGLGEAYRPYIDVDADRVPVDGLLLEALPEKRGGENAATRVSAREVLEGLNIEGTVDCLARLRPSAESVVGYELEVTFDDVAAHPEGASVEISDLAGAIHFTPEKLTVSRLDGMLAQKPFSLTFAAGLAGEPDERLPMSGTFTADDLDLALPIEAVLDRAAPEEMQLIRDLRKTHNPMGRLDASLEFESRGETFDYDIQITDAQSLAIDALGGRVRLENVTGATTVTESVVHFDALEADLSIDDHPSARISIDGDYARSPELEGRVEIGIDGGRFESAMVREAAERLSDSTNKLLETWNPAGEFDLRGVYATQAGGVEPTTTWTLTPRSMTLTRHGTPIEFHTVSGRLERDEAGGIVEDLKLEAEGWSLSAGGSWRDEPAFAMEGAIELEAQSFSPGLLGAMPDPVAEVLEAIDFTVTDRLYLQSNRFEYREGEGAGVLFDASAEFSGVGLRPGVPVAGAQGSADIRYAREKVGSQPELAMTVRADAFTAAGAELTDGYMSIVQGETPGSVLLQFFEASSNGGRIVGRAAFTDAQRHGIAETGRAYEVHLEAADIRFGPLMEQLGRGAESEDEVEEEAGDPDRGVLDASLAMFGVHNAPAHNRGRGTVRVQGGDVLQMPGVTPILELSNLQIPGGEKMDLGYAEFLIADDRLRFQDLLLYSDSIRINGEGGIALPDLELDLRVQTRGMHSVPILSDLFQTVREEFVSTRVSGTLYDPRFEYEQLSGTRHMFDVMLGGDDSEEDDRRR